MKPIGLNGRHTVVKPSFWENLYTDEDPTLKARFQFALVARIKSDVRLSEVIAEMIEAGIERDEAIDWAIEAGISESRARGVVSQMYSDVEGRARVEGGGRKAMPLAVAYAQKIVRECDGNLKKAEKIALAAWRQVQRMRRESKRGPARRSSERRVSRQSSPDNKLA